MTQQRLPQQLPPLFTATPQSLIETANEINASTQKLLDDIATLKPEQATFKNTVQRIAWADNVNGLEDRILGLYSAVATDEKLREASTKAENILSEAAVDFGMREDIYKLVQAAYDKKEKLDPESQRLLEKTRKDYISCGLGISAGPKRDRFKEIQKRLANISTEFSKTLNEEDGGIWATEEELEGVPKDVIQGLAKGSGEHEGKLKLSFKYPDLVPTQKFATNPETRKRLMIDNENKCNSNAALFKEAIVLRDEAARLLGYKNWAEFRLEDKMAKTIKTVTDFLNDLRTQLTPGGKEEIKHLKEIKRKWMADNGKKAEDDDYYLWDHRFYDRLMIEQEYTIDENKIAEYFPITKTIQGMMNIFEKLFGLKFEELNAETRDKLSSNGNGRDLIWHDDVKMFSVWDDEREGGEFVGYLYLDLHPRPGKYGHAANFGIQPGFVTDDGSRRYPCTALICNFSKPTPDKPALLKHDEVVTFFHELGHGIHDLVARVTYARFHGTSVVRDFVEAPSQMLENWTWEPKQLKSLSSHYETGESMPDELLNSLVKTKNVNGALFNLRQLHFGLFDVTIHSPTDHQEAEKRDYGALYNELRSEICCLTGPEKLGGGLNWGNGQATFGHLMGGYDAGYYGYLSSQVYSTDMYHSVFAKDPMNEAQGRRYRRLILEKGGSQDEMQTLEGFLGRKPNAEAFYKDLGIKKNQ